MMHGFGMGGFWMIIPLLLFGFIFYVLFRDNHFVHNSKDHDQALEILKTKYAQGEITEEEFIRKKELITK